MAGTSYTYDGRGNLHTDGSRTFTYDVENRLTAESSAAFQVNYDPTGRLYQTVSGSTTTQYLYSDDRLVAEYNGGTVLRRYVHGPGTDVPVVWYEGVSLTTRNWLHTDERGSVIATTDGTGAATTYTYGPYGEPSTWTGSRFKYTGQIAFPEVKLYHFKARAYDPGIGRFLQTDPIGQTDDANLYSYVGDDPTDRVDSRGEEGEPASNQEVEQNTCSRVGASSCSGSYRGDGTHNGGDGSSTGEKSGQQNQTQSSNGASAGSTPAPATPAASGEADETAAGEGADSGPMENRRSGRGGQGQGERGRAAKPSGTPTPGKGVRPARGQPGRWEQKDPHTGQWKLKPPGWLPPPKDAMEGAAAIGTGYIIYRIIRMVPSLFPPLWPTIPENAVIP